MQAMWSINNMIQKLQKYSMNYQLFQSQEKYYKTMEELAELRLSRKIEGKLSNSQSKYRPLDQVVAHCKKDHLDPTPFDQRKHISSYVNTYSPSKNSTNFNHSDYEKGLQQFRKNQNSTSALSILPTIGGHSHYRDAYIGHSPQKLVKGKENETFFLKMNWAQNPTSQYQKTYLQKDGLLYNKQNKERPNNNHLSVSGLQDGRKRVSNYRTQFHPYNIVKQAQLSICNQDHLASKNQSQADLVGISEYQRRYDSVMELANPKQTAASIYRKQVLLFKKLK